jgi:hypothetical protein
MYFWARDLGPKRNALFHEVNAERPQGFSLVLETDNSAFHRYGFVAVIGNTLKDSFEPEMRVKSRVMSRASTEALHSLLDGHIGDIQGAESDVDDGSCYFLTVHVGSTTRQVAIYGDVGSTVAGRLVTELLSQTGWYSSQ